MFGIFWNLTSRLPSATSGRVYSMISLTRDKLVMKPMNQIRWRRLALIFTAVLAVSIGLAILLDSLVARLNLPLNQFAWLAYLLVFSFSLAASSSIFVPVPFGVSIMLAAAANWNPLLVALTGSVGGTLGELSGYYAGYLGKKVAIPETIIGYKRLEQWINRYGMWAILILGLQPFIPFDLGGLIAGAAKMPLRKFLPALFLGKFPKYVAILYLGMRLVNFLPSWFKLP